MREYEQKLIELLNSTPLPLEAKMYVLFKHVRDVQDAVQNSKRKPVEGSEAKDEQMS